MSDVTTIEADVPERYADAVSKRLGAAADERVVERIWSRDATLWAPAGTPEVADRLGWLDIADRVLLGMGGSSLAPEVFRRTFDSAEGLTPHVLDSTHPAQVQAVLDSVDL